MNYRHVFHAGNFADCMKHALLVALIKTLQRKPAPLSVLDTHAGAGRYDLESEPARRSGEAASGVLRLLSAPRDEGALSDYLGLVEHPGFYPGSPALIASLLRPDDRLVCCEARPDDHATLRHLFAGDKRVAVHCRDGWDALKALLPPARQRGLVLIDPPFEEKREFVRLAEGLVVARARFPSGVLAAWYPVKHRAPVRTFFDGLALRDVIAAELLLREPLDPSRLNGCGLVIANPPFRFEQEAQSILGALLDRLGNGEPGQAALVRRIADE